MSAPPISTILGRQRADGAWPGTNMYGPKYQGSHWANLLLTEYGVDTTDARVRRGARRILEDLSTRPNAMEWVLGRDHGMSCFTGSVIRYLALAGYGTDPRVGPLLQRLGRDAKKFDAAGGINGEKPCARGYARLVWGLPAFPEAARPPEGGRVTPRGGEFL